MKRQYYRPRFSFSKTLRSLFILLLLLAGTSSTAQAKLQETQNLAAGGPDDEYYELGQWALNDSSIAKLNVPAAWNITTGIPIVVAVIDTGLDVDHPDFKNLDGSSKNTGTGHNFINDDNNIQDEDGHGTAVSGIIGAVTNNKQGIAGMSWGALIMPIKVAFADRSIKDCQPKNEEMIFKAIKWAIANQARVINMSFICRTTAAGYIQWQAAIDEAYNNGIVLVAGAGNDNQDLDQWPPSVPAGLNHVIAVGATDRYDHRCGLASCQYQSGYGSKLDVMAPGSPDTYTTDLVGWNGSNQSPSPTGDYVFSFGGTSAATPFVAGLTALMLSVHPTMSPDSVEFVIQHTADDLGNPGKDNTFGYGRINAYKAVRRAATCFQGAWPGDANEDCKVDGIDYVIWLNNYEKPNPSGPATGDFNNDGVVDGVDYVIWLNNYGK